jgi:hypothetical protein
MMPGTPGWAQLLAGRRVSVIMDCDRAGRKAVARTVPVTPNAGGGCVIAAAQIPARLHQLEAPMNLQICRPLYIITIIERDMFTPTQGVIECQLWAGPGRSRRRRGANSSSSSSWDSSANSLPVAQPSDVCDRAFGCHESSSRRYWSHSGAGLPQRYWGEVPDDGC